MQKMFTVEKQVLPYSANTPVGEYAWTRGSPKNMLLFKALQWANAEGTPLQELDGAVLIRAGLHENNPNTNCDGSNLCQVVNTVWVAHRSKDGWTVSYCRLPNSDAGVKLAKDGYDLNYSNDKELILPLDDAVLHAMTDEAQKRGRVVPALTSSPCMLALQTRDYERNSHIAAAFGGKEHGQKVAAVNAACLQDRNCDYGYLRELAIDDLEKILPKDDSRAQTHAVIRPVGLDDGRCNGSGIGGVGADYLFYYCGRARGGTSDAKNSTGNEGKTVDHAK